MGYCIGEQSRLIFCALKLSHYILAH